VSPTFEGVVFDKSLGEGNLSVAADIANGVDVARGVFDQSYRDPTNIHFEGGCDPEVIYFADHH
jgi:hypothetical protein